MKNSNSVFQNPRAYWIAMPKLLPRHYIKQRHPMLNKVKYAVSSSFNSARNFSKSGMFQKNQVKGVHHLQNRCGNRCK